MDQDALVELLAKQVDALDSLLIWYVAIICAATYAAIRNEEKVSLGPVAVDAKHVPAIASTILIIFGLGILIALIRIRAILLQLDFGHIPDGLTTILYSPSITNPFAYFGSDALSRISCAISYGLFFLITIVAILPVSTSEGGSDKLIKIIFRTWLVIGLFIGIMLFVDYRIIHVKAAIYSPELANNLSWSLGDKTLALGYVMFIVARLNMHIRKWRRETWGLPAESD